MTGVCQTPDDRVVGLDPAAAKLPPWEFFIYHVPQKGEWHAKAVRAPARCGFKTKVGVLRHVTLARKEEALDLVERWRRLCASPPPRFS
jgi:hypothetical protein